MLRKLAIAWGVGGVLLQPASAALAAEGKMSAKDVARAIKTWKIDAEKPNPLTV